MAAIFYFEKAEIHTPCGWKFKYLNFEGYVMNKDVTICNTKFKVNIPQNVSELSFQNS